jgi:hypothetical protein
MNQVLEIHFRFFPRRSLCDVAVKAAGLLDLAYFLALRNFCQDQDAPVKACEGMHELASVAGTDNEIYAGL